jgi:hypothetical protein
LGRHWAGLLGGPQKARVSARRPGTTKAVVYNTLEEIRKFGEALGEITGNEG